MPPASVPPVDAIQALVGYEFPGGTYTIAHWENFLLTECTGSEPLPDGLVHPVALFHVPILGAGTTIGGLFALGQAESDMSIGIERYEWEFLQPLREEVPYRVTGRVTAAERQQSARGTWDRIQFRFDLADEAGEPAATSTITWRYWRSVA